MKKKAKDKSYPKPRRGPKPTGAHVAEPPPEPEPEPAPQPVPEPEPAPESDTEQPRG
jgi:hypothetical protein